MTVFFSNFCLDTGFLDEDEYIIIESTTAAESEVRREETSEEWVKKHLINDEMCNALPQTYDCSICGRHCQDEKKYNLHLLGKFYIVCTVSDIYSRI